MDIDFTPRGIAKEVVTSAITLKANELLKTAIADNTRYDEDTIPCRVIRGIVSGYVGQKLKPHTDKMVDKTADFIAAKRADRAAQKETTEK